VTRTPFLTVLFTLTALLAAVIAAPAEAAERKVPFGFFGTVVPTSTYLRTTDAAFDQQTAVMARSGVESVRFAPNWDVIEPAPGMYNWGTIDQLVAAAARHRLAVLLNVTSSPPWASEQPGSPDAFRWGPKDPQTYAELMRQLVLRYGPRGSFWTQSPGLPRVPVRHWQIWNEQTAPWFWERQPWAPSYTQLLKAAYRAIHQADPGAKVVAGSLVAPRRDYAPWDAIRDLYRAGARGFFDEISIHPFTNNPKSVSITAQQVVEMVRRVRAPMRRQGDGRKPIILTEVTWPAALGKVPRNALFGLETTARGQALRLTASYRQLARESRKLHITQAYWYTWASEYDANEAPSAVSFRFSGLTRIAGGAFYPMPILKTYAKVAAEQEGCRKSSNARRCR
jgi:hypothetical protein